VAPVPDAAPRVVRPRVDAGPRTAEPLPDADFQRGVRAKHGRIESCIGEWIKRSENASTAFEVRFQIGPDGRVRSASSRGLDDVPTSDCVTAAVRDAEFAATPAVTSGRIAIMVETGEITIRSEITGASEPGQTIDLGP
jgi:hypothetical protein